jgi:hypothetical protein
MHRWHSSGEKARTQPMNHSTNWYQCVVERVGSFYCVCELQVLEYVDCVYNAF